MLVCHLTQHICAYSVILILLLLLCTSLPSQRQESWCPGSGGDGHDGGGFVLYNWLRATWLLGRWSSQWGECMHRLARVFDLLTKFVTCSTTMGIIQLRVHDNVIF